MARSSIEWTESTWNPVTGCSRISVGCRHCYAERMANRLRAMGQPNYANGFDVAIHPHVLDKPLTWNKPQMIFVNSMSDLFHKRVPTSFVLEVFEVMKRAHWHTFQVLTKRSGRLLQLDNQIEWPRNVWMGVTVETDSYLHRIDELRKTGAVTKFISFEPLLAAIPRSDLSGIDWAIVGGESGPGARPMRKEWVIELRDQCVEQDVPFFFKQWGGFNKKRSGRVLDGRTWNQLPVRHASNPV